MFNYENSVCSFSFFAAASYTECRNYVWINDSVIPCPDKIPPAFSWYRFAGEHSNKLKTACQSSINCSLRMDGVHPSVNDGIVKSFICRDSINSCCLIQKNMKVLNCGPYYVYFFEDYYCYELFCTTFD